jgi:hypothetical protein
MDFENAVAIAAFSNETPQGGVNSTLVPYRQPKKLTFQGVEVDWNRLRSFVDEMPDGRLFRLFAEPDLVRHATVLFPLDENWLHKDRFWDVYRQAVDETVGGLTERSKEISLEEMAEETIGATADCLCVVEMVHAVEEFLEKNRGDWIFSKVKPHMGTPWEKESMMVYSAFAGVMETVAKGRINEASFKKMCDYWNRQKAKQSPPRQLILAMT